jgi:hypothetical protein
MSHDPKPDRVCDSLQPPRLNHHKAENITVGSEALQSVAGTVQ